MNFEKRLIQVFKSFVEKNFLPSLRKTDPCVFEWNKFASMISLQPINLNELEFYIQNINNSTVTVFTSNTDKNIGFKEANNGFFGKKRQESGGKQFGSSPLTQVVSGVFNPSKTFGGQRAKAMFPLKGQFDENFGQSHTPTVRKQRKQSYNMKKDPFQKTTNNAQAVLTSLEKLYANLLQNQQKIQSYQPNSNSNHNIGGNTFGYYNNSAFQGSMPGSIGNPIGNNNYEYKNHY